MKILAINGSPRGTKGITGFLLDLFLEGAKEAGAEAETIILAREKIRHCTGEFHCWLNETGKCIWDEKNGDTMGPIRTKLAEAENLALATPVYADGMTGLMKNMFDRCIPTLLPHMELDENGDLRHPTRFMKPDKKIVLLSTAGFPEMETFAPLVLHIERIARNLNSRLVGKVLRPNGMIMPFEEFLGGKLEPVKRAVTAAGREYVEKGSISEAVENEISIEFLPKETFVMGSKMFWDKAIKKGTLKPIKK